MRTTDNQNEMFVVVDENDTIIGYKTRKECHSDKSLIHRSASVVITNSKGEVLLQKRSMTKDMYPGYFTISASGHVGKGETYEDAARREMFEEIGVMCELKFVKTFLLRAPFETEFVALFTARYDGPFELNKKEVEDVIYMSRKSIGNIKDKLTPAAWEDFMELGIV